MKVLKFGGSSVGTPDRILDVARLVEAAVATDRVVVVVSAFGGVTNALIDAAQRAIRGGPQWRADIEGLAKRHLDALDEVAAPAERAELAATVREATEDVRDLLHGVSLVRECTPRTLDNVMGYGERMSALVVAAALRGKAQAALACDARLLVVTDQAFGAARVDFVKTYARIQ